MKRLLRILCLMLATAVLPGCATRTQIRATTARLVPGESLAESLGKAEAAWRNDSAAGRTAYRASLRSFFAEMPYDWQKKTRIEMPHGGGWIEIAQQRGDGQYRASDFDEIETIAKTRVNKIVPAGVRSGWGLPAKAIGRLDLIAERVPGKRVPGWISPATLFVEFPAQKPGAPRAVVRLLDPRTRSGAAKSRPLAADFSSMIHASLGRPNFLKMAFSGLLHPERWFGESGMFMLEPYDPGKVPVIMVHGLQSDPHIWENTATALMSDPKIGSRIQVWYFMYPTGLPIPGSASRLRGTMSALKKAVDPEGDDFATNHMFMIGHSMGGLLTRMQVIDSGNDLYRAYFRKPMDKLAVTPGTKRMFQRSFFFEYNPGIRRAVFVCVPHRGSQIADINLVRLFTNIVQIPKLTAQAIAEVLTLDFDAINPQLFQYNNLGANSIDMLSAKHPFFGAMEKRPIKVPFHSIIGDRGKGIGEKSSDGVVPYWSSHLGGAQTEKILPYPHGCVERPEVVAEIQRIVGDNLPR